MPEPKFYQYEVFIAGDDVIYFDGRFRNRDDAVCFLTNYLDEHRHLWITDACCTQIGMETDLMNVKNI